MPDAFTGKPSKSRIFTQIGGGAVVIPAHAFWERLKENDALLTLTLLHIRAGACQAVPRVDDGTALATPARNLCFREVVESA